MRTALALGLALASSASAAPLKVSVLYFDNNTGRAEYEPLKKGLADMLITDLAQLPGVTVVERERLQAVLDEQKLSRFLDARPKSPHFPEARKAVEDLLMVSPDVAGAVTAIEKCQPDAQVKFTTAFGAVARAEGRPGLERLVKQVEACAPKQGALAMGWKVNGYLIAAGQAAYFGDCDFVRAMKAKAHKLGPMYAGAFTNLTACGE
ncbi:MAG: CsgG/HfaB family protein [Myxococcota bacterium]